MCDLYRSLRYIGTEKYELSKILLLLLTRLKSWILNIYRITVATKFRRNPCWTMNCSQPEVVNSFNGIAHEDGSRVYLAPDDTLKIESVQDRT